MKHSVIKVSVKPDYILSLPFDDGLQGDVDLSSELKGDLGPMFEPLKNPEYFSKVSVDPRLGVVCWPNDLDFDSDRLYREVSESKSL